MTQFDALLRRALMDANLAQYQRNLQDVEAGEPEFSSGYLRERMRLLADPWDWGRRQDRPGGQKRRLHWRLIAIIAALLLLSACAYVVATGQFSRWFPRRGVDPKRPETSEEVLSGTGTVIGQSRTVGDETVTLNAAVWDGNSMWLSLVLESPHISEEIRQYTPLYTGGCRLSLRQDQWEAYTRNRWEEFYASEEPDMSPEQLEAAVRARLDEENRAQSADFDVLGREGGTLTLEVTTPLFAGMFPEAEQPEVTLHLENIAAYEERGSGGDGVPRESELGSILLRGPFDFTFTLERPVLPLFVRYDAADAELPPLDIPFRFTGFKLSTTRLTALYEAQDPKELPGHGEILVLIDSLRGLWTEDGTYVDLTSEGGSATDTAVSRNYPYPIDPAAVTAVDIGGARVELSELERLD